MFYKEDGSYDVKSFYEHRLIDEYQEVYGVGKDVGEVRGLKRGQKLGLENAIKSLSQNGMSNENISNGLNIPIERVEEILNKKNLKLKVLFNFMTDGKLNSNI